MEFHAEVTQGTLGTTNNQDFLKKVITEDKSWVYGSDLGTKAQSGQWKSHGSPHPKKVCIVQVTSKLY